MEHTNDINCHKIRIFLLFHFVLEFTRMRVQYLFDMQDVTHHPGRGITVFSYFSTFGENKTCVVVITTLFVKQASQAQFNTILTFFPLFWLRLHLSAFHFLSFILKACKTALCFIGKKNQRLKLNELTYRPYFSNFLYVFETLPQNKADENSV